MLDNLRTEINHNSHIFARFFPDLLDREMTKDKRYRGWDGQ